MHEYLFLCAHDGYLLSFRLPEIVCAAQSVMAHGRGPPYVNTSDIVSRELSYDTSYSAPPYIFLNLADDAMAASVAKRCVSCRVVLDVLGEGTTLEAAVQSVDPSRITPYRDVSFKFIIDSFGRKNTYAETMTVIESCSSLKLMGKIDMKNPDLLMWVLFDYGVEQQHTDHGETQVLPMNAYKRVYIARQVSDGNRDALTRFKLSDRKHISSTAMRPDLSFYVSNLACVKPNDIVLDPFVGTGSLILAAASLGAYVIGCDLDPKVLRGDDVRMVKLTRDERKRRWQQINQDVKQYTPDWKPNLVQKAQSLGVVENRVHANFVQYGLERKLLDTVRSDFSYCPLHMQLDAIVCDPPYGVRAGARKSDIEFHCGVRPYAVRDLLQDLLYFSAKRLRVNGRLCYWLPTHSDFTLDDIPKHPALEV